jgi:hypothetical protein
MDEQQIKNDIILTLLANERYEHSTIDEIISVTERLTQYIMSDIVNVIDEDEIIHIECPQYITDRLNK